MKEFTIDLHDGRGNQVYVLKIDQLAALEAAVKAEATRIIKGNFTQICSYCGEEMLPPNGWNELQAHIQICPQHPLKKANEQIAALAEKDARIKELEGALEKELPHIGIILDALINDKYASNKMAKQATKDALRHLGIAKAALTAQKEGV